MAPADPVALLPPCALSVDVALALESLGRSGCRGASSCRSLLALLLVLLPAILVVLLALLPALLWVFRRPRRPPCPFLFLFLRFRMWPCPAASAATRSRRPNPRRQVASAIALLVACMKVDWAFPGIFLHVHPFIHSFPVLLPALRPVPTRANPQPNLRDLRDQINQVSI